MEYLSNRGKETLTSNRMDKGLARSSFFTDLQRTKNGEGGVTPSLIQSM